VTGYNAFIDFDPGVLEFESGVYTNAPFPVHISPIDPVAGSFALDGSVIPGNPGTDMNAVLATFCFRVRKFAAGVPTTIEFGPPPTPSINSELSVDGVPVPTILESTGILTQSTMGLRLCYEPMMPICVLLEATCLDGPINGYTAELTYDNDALEFLPGDSGYEPAPFTIHVNDPITPVIVGSTAEVSLDGEIPGLGAPTMDDQVLATLCFNIRPGFEAIGGMLSFQPPMPGLESEFLLDGEPVATFLRDSPLFGSPGDINIDGMVDFTDLAAFTDVLLNIDMDEARRLRSDLNCDAHADGLDVAEFVNLILP